MINPKCDKCGRELEEPGAVLFSPPIGGGFGDLVVKRHLCRQCWYDIDHLLNANKTSISYDQGELVSEQEFTRLPFIPMFIRPEDFGGDPDE